MSDLKIWLLIVIAVTAGCASTPSKVVYSDTDSIKAIFEAHDSTDDDGLEDYLSRVSDDVILMPHDGQAVFGKQAYKAHIEESRRHGTLSIKHELIEAYSYPEIVIARGKATGSFQPNGRPEVYPFETKNIFIFRRLASGELKVWQIIFNMSPTESS